MTVSIVDTEYAACLDTECAACGCSPIGKMKRASLPYAPGTPAGSIKWVTYNYDDLGRTISVVQPDNSGTTAYVYAGASATVTDAAGKWKK